MSDNLLNYYERELTFIREMGAEFARKYPKIAGRLLLEPDKCEDPHTERLIEAFAFIAGRIHKKIDDDFPEITESLLNIIYPHYVNPIPSMSVVKFDPIIPNIPDVGYQIDKHTKLYSKPINGNPLQFSTCYPVMLWPVDILSASLSDPKKLVENAQQAIVLQLRCSNFNFSDLKWERLRFFLNGPHQHIFHLYELLLNNVCHIECISVNQGGVTETICLSPNDITLVGFNLDEGMLPYTSRSFPGYLLLFEYFCFPEKFLYFDLNGLEKMRGMNFYQNIEIRIYLNKAVKSNLVINEDTFCLHTTPVINLFKRTAEPVRVEHRKTEYHVIPDLRRQAAAEIYSIDRVTSSASSRPDTEVEFMPLYSLRHYVEGLEEQKAYWYMQRVPSGKKGDEGTEVYLSFADLNLKSIDPEAEILTVHTTCTNRDLPVRLPFGDPSGDFDMELAAPVTRICCIIKPTPVRRPTLGGKLQWSLISHLSLNYLSLLQGGGETLKEILKLYDYDNSPSTRQQINGIVSLHTNYVTKRIGQSFCRGVRVTIDFDENKYVGAGLFLFASVLERFLGLYVSVNSFSQLVARTSCTSEVIKVWAPRSGDQIFL